MSTISSNLNILSTLTQASVNASLQSASLRFNTVQQAIQRDFQKKVAAVQANPNQSNDNLLKNQLQILTTQKANFTKFRVTYATNNNVFGDLANQLTGLQDAITNGDSDTFNSLLANSNEDVANLAVVQQLPQFQPDGVLAFKNNGLGIQSAESYDLSTPEGQAAALAAVTAAEQSVGQAIQITTINQTIAGQLADNLDQKIGSVQNQLQQDQLDQLSAQTLQVQKLQQQSANQLHLIQLAFANSADLSKGLLTQQFNDPTANQPGTIFSIFG